MGKKQRIGVIATSKSLKTIIVIVQNKYEHLKYQKPVIKTTRYMVHDEKNEGNPGDLVIIEESRPISKHKTWILKSVLSVYKT